MIADVKFLLSDMYTVLTRRWSGQQNSTNPLLPRSLGFFHGEVAFSDMKDKIRTRGTDRGAKKESGFPNLHPGSFQFLKSLNARQLEGGEARDRGSTKGSASERRLHHATSKKKKLGAHKYTFPRSFLSKRAISARFARYG